MSLFYKFFDISNLNFEARNFISRSFIVIFIFAFISMFTNTFIILFALEKLSITQLGVVIALQFVIQSISDYPTGAIGDWIGQKWIIFIASLVYSLDFILLSLANSF